MIWVILLDAWSLALVWFWFLDIKDPLLSRQYKVQITALSIILAAAPWAGFVYRAALSSLFTFDPHIH